MANRALSPLIPYAAVAIGMYCFGSAWLAMISYHVGMLLVALIGKGRDRATGKRGVPGWWLFCSVVYAFGGIALYVLWPYAFSDSAAIVARLGSFGITRHVWPYFAVYFCCVNSLSEELYWRGYLRDDASGPTAHDFAFAGYHALVFLAFAGVAWALLVFAACAFAGWLWRRMRAATGSLAMPVITHIIADLGIVAAVNLRLFA